MPTAYENLAPYLRPGHPIESSSDSAIGCSYVYRGPTSTLTTNKPLPGAAWADSRPVVTAQIFEFSGGSDYSELMVVTSQSASYSGVIGTPAVEEEFYNLRWRPVQKPLEIHPDFQTGGDYELGEDGRKCIIGWRAEQDPALRAARKFRQLDSDGTPGEEVDIATVSPNALEFIKLLEIGVEEYVDYMPIWRKRSMYRGSVAPPNDPVGIVDTPPGSPPSGYEWVKSADDCERVGLTTRWRRDEEWEGAITVYASSVSVYPPA